MSKSLQEQLQALGLAKKSPARRQRDQGRNPASGMKQKPRPEAGKETTRSVVAEKPASGPELSLEQAYRLREKQTKEQAEQARERKRLYDLQRRQLNDDIRSILALHRLNDPSAELSRNFMYKGRIRKVNVTAAQLKALNEGTLGLVYLAGGYHILAPEYVAEVRSLSAEHVPDLAGSTDEDPQYPVPDDLIW
jgi:uncharacterized protein YaiL (DUF2058 family)